ncbi:MAG: prepilin-type N-terminal cleavage/methylation domain-containing protein [Planctomycetales bacterium]|nr:prepilin-type N-terminal cleavage/methylation domain-containing protein [Planctomycetales bacterium]
MKNGLNRCEKQKAFTLIECLVVMLISMIGFGGLLGFRYYAVLSAERAETHLLAAQTAHVLIEAWKGQKGTTDFDPTLQGFDADFQVQAGSASAASPLSEASCLHLGNYQVVVEGRHFRADLLYQNMTDIPKLRTLYVVLSWQDKQAQQFRLSALTQT